MLAAQDCAIVQLDASSLRLPQTCITWHIASIVGTKTMASSSDV